jgi:hypothetical protein
MYTSVLFPIEKDINQVYLVLVEDVLIILSSSL